LGGKKLYHIIEKRELAPSIVLMEVEAPRVAKSAKPGQFVIVRISEKGERIPLTICNYDIKRGTVTIVFQAIGSSTNEMLKLNKGDYLADFAGPLGQPSEFIHEDLEELKKQKIMFVAGGVGAAPVYPQVKWLRQNGVDVDVIVGGKTKDFLLLINEMKELGASVYPCTDDGSAGFKGLVTNQLKELIDGGKKYDVAIAIGPMIMMKFVAKLTKEYDLKTIVSLNTLMVDGTGMCGACRVTVGDGTKFACVDGPEFDGHLVNFDEAMRRQTLYKSEEGRKLVAKEKAEGHKCSCMEGKN
jgi:ferredoxin--NADP+ reductase